MDRCEDGRFKKGMSYSPSTQFKLGEHWRDKKPYYEKDWLIEQYVTKKRSAGDIAVDFGVTDAAILFWLRKHEIERRSISDARTVKMWGCPGESNPMWGKKGIKNKNWKGGHTPLRQSFYVSDEWKKVRKLVWIRDKAYCQRCNIKKKGKEPFHIHHIVSFKVKHLRAELTNLILLCKSCHDFVHSNKNIHGEFISKI